MGSLADPSDGRLGGSRCHSAMFSAFHTSRCAVGWPTDSASPPVKAPITTATNMHPPRSAGRYRRRGPTGAGASASSRRPTRSRIGRNFSSPRVVCAPSATRYPCQACPLHQSSHSLAASMSTVRMRLIGCFAGEFWKRRASELTRIMDCACVLPGVSFIAACGSSGRGAPAGRSRFTWYRRFLSLGGIGGASGLGILVMTIWSLGPVCGRRCRRAGAWAAEIPWSVSGNTARRCRFGMRSAPSRKYLESKKVHQGKIERS